MSAALGWSPQWAAGSFGQQQHRCCRGTVGRPHASSVELYGPPAPPPPDPKKATLKAADGSSIQLGRILNGMWQTSGGWGSVDPNAAVESMRQYAAAGFTTFDLADHYGPAEDLYGVFLDRCRREQGEEAASHVAGLTKWVPQPVRMTRAVVKEAVERSRKRMRVAAVDMLQFHWWDYSDPGYLDALKHLTDLKEEGKIRTLGLTNFDTQRMMLIVEAGIPIASNQVQHSLVDMRPQQPMADLCRLTGVQLLTYGTLCGGLLSDKWLDKKEPGKFLGAALETPSQKKYKRMIDALGGWAVFQELLRACRAIGRKHRASISQVATAAILRQPAVGGVIIGCRFGISNHVRENEAVFSLELDEEDIERLEAVLKDPRRKDLLQVIGDCGDEYR